PSTDKASPGILVYNSSSCLLLTVTGSDGKSSQNNSKETDGATATTLDYGKWYYMCLNWDAIGRIATIYYGSPGDTAVKTTQAGPTGDASLENITPAEGFTWTFNDSGNLSYYGTTYPTTNTLVETDYDDIAIFQNQNLTSNDVLTIINSSSALPSQNLSL